MLTACLFYLTMCCIPPHDYHSSISEVRYMSKKQTVEVTIQIFTDDLEVGLKRKLGLKSVQLDKTKKYHTEIGEYALANFQIQNSKKQAVKGAYIGKEQENELTLLYIEFPAKGFSNVWQVRNQILTEIFDDQSNIINFFQGNASISNKTVLFKKGTNWTAFP